MRSSLWPNILSLFVVVFCIYSLTAWHPLSRDENSKTVRENAFFSNIYFREFNEKGELKNQFNSIKLSILSNKEVLFTKPNFLLITTDHTPWTASSEKGIGYNNGEKVQLTGSVHLTQFPTAQSPQTDITTTSLWLFPKKSYATTDEVIHVDRPGMKISGKGMQADIKNDYFTLQRETTGFYSPSEKEQAYQFQSHSMQYNGKNHTATYFQDVHIAKATEKIDGDTVTVHTGASNEIHDLVALGNPAHYQSIQKDKPDPLNASAQSIRYNAKQNIAILERNAKVTQGKDELNGEYVWYDVKKGIAKTKAAASKNKTVILLGPDKPAK